MPEAQVRWFAAPPTEVLCGSVARSDQPPPTPRRPRRPSTVVFDVEGLACEARETRRACQFLRCCCCCRAKPAPKLTCSLALPHPGVCGNLPRTVYCCCRRKRSAPRRRAPRKRRSGKKPRRKPAAKGPKSPAAKKGPRAPCRAPGRVAPRFVFVVHVCVRACASMCACASACACVRVCCGGGGGSGGHPRGFCQARRHLAEPLALLSACPSDEAA